MSNKFRIEPYKENEYEKYLFQIIKANMKDYCDRHFETGWSDEQNKKGFFETLEKGKIYTLKYSEEIIGIFSFEIRNNELYLKEIQIKKEFQKNGFGKICLNFIEDLAKKYNCNSIGLTVFKDNPAKNLYIKFGFKIIGDRFNGSGFSMIKEVI